MGHLWLVNAFWNNYVVRDQWWQPSNCKALLGLSLWVALQRRPEKQYDSSVLPRAHRALDLASKSCLSPECRPLATNQIQLHPCGNAVVKAIFGLAVCCYSWRDAHNFGFELSGSARIRFLLLASRNTQRSSIAHVRTEERHRMSTKQKAYNADAVLR